MSVEWKAINIFRKKDRKAGVPVLVALLALVLAITVPGQILAGEPAPANMPESASTDILEPMPAVPWVSITKTGIHADSVFNAEGYGSLIIRGDNSEISWENIDDRIPAQVALIDSSGTFCFPYRADTVGSYEAGDASFYCSGGIVSLTVGSSNSWAGTPLYYRLDGSSAFILEAAEREYTDNETGLKYNEKVSYQGGPLTDGYAVVAKIMNFSWLGTGSLATDWKAATCIVDKAGTVVYELPSEDNEVLQWGAGGFTTSKSLGRCGEGLIAFVKYARGDDAWNLDIVEAGYMNPSGQTVIDLTGQGYVNSYPFRNGLAAVQTQERKFGFIDKTGTLVIPCVYDNFVSFGNDGLCAVEKDGKWGYIDKSGRIVIPFEYDEAFGAENRLAAVGRDGKYGLVDYANRVIVPLEFDDISTCEGGVAYAIRDGFVYVITIQDSAISIKECTIKNISKKAYTGKALKPALTITYKGEKLEEGIDYTVKYSNNKKTGRATVTINGIGAYTGTAKKTFDIVPAKVEGVKIASGKAGAMTVSWKKDTMASGYVIEYSTDSSIKKNVGKVTVGTNATASRKIEGLKSQKTYYVRVRAYKIINGKKRYGKYSGIVKVAVK